MEAFERIYLDLSKQPGKCRLAEAGLGWKPSGGGDTFTLDTNNLGAAQWSRAARGYELKIMSRTSGVVQLDGFEQEVRPPLNFQREFDLLYDRTLTALLKPSNCSTASILKPKSTLYADGIGAKVNLERQSLHSTFRIGQPSRYHIRRSPTPILRERTR